MSWTALNLSDKARIEKAIKNNSLVLSDYSFTNLWMWNQVRCYQIALVDSFLCLKYIEDGKEVFLYPLGRGSRNQVIQKLMDMRSFHMRAIPENAAISLPLSPEVSHYDYIYRYEDLLNLAGNEYQPKRNLIHQFTNNYTFEYLPIDTYLIPQIRKMEQIWFEEHEGSPGLEKEHQGVLHLLDEFEHLNALGAAILVDGKVIAYTIGEYLTNDMLLIHIEKAHTAYKGAYQMINQQFLKTVRPVLFVNREEDLGLPNIAKIKQSYHPLRFEKKFVLKNY